MDTKVTEILSQFVVDTRYKDIPAPAIERAKISFLDITGVMLAGAAFGEAGKIAIKYAKGIGGVPESTVVGGGFQTSATNAALVNGLLSHALDFDDWEPSGHPSGMLVSASLAMGEKLGRSGKDVLEAYLLGLELYEKIAEGHADVIERGWHSSPVYGTLGAAAVAGKLLGLNAHQMVMALGIAASSASGIIREHGTMAKPYQVGKAARNGIEAALLAKEGFTGDAGIIENSGGFIDCFLGGDPCDYSQMVRNIGNPFHNVSPGIGLKPYPCGGIKFFRCIEGIRKLKAENNLACEDVEWLEARVSDNQSRKDVAEPQTALQGKFSMRYLCARTLLDGTITLGSFTDTRVTEPAAKQAMSKVRIVVDKEIPVDWMQTWAQITIKLKDGRLLSKKITIPEGDQRNPLSLEAVQQKYRNNASLILSKSQAEKALGLIQDLDKIESLDPLMDVLKCS